jgi:hypothetical protein
MLFVGVGRFSGKRAVGSIGDVVIVARNVLNRRRLRRDGQILPLLWRIALGLGLRKDSVGNLEVTMRWAMEAGGIASTWKLLR